MRIVLIVVFAVAALFAGGAFYFVLQYIKGAEEDARIKAALEKPGVDAVDVLVAEMNLAAGTVIKAEHFDWQPWPDDSLHGDYIVYREDDGPDKDDLGAKLTVPMIAFFLPVIFLVVIGPAVVQMTQL